MGLAVTKQEAFWEACGYGRIYEVKGMLAAGGINVNWKSYTHDCCPIHVASQGKKEIVVMLLEANCDVNARDDRDNLAIHHAAMKGHTDIIQLLLNAGSKKDCIDKNGWTPLINAAYWCQPEVCDLLVKNGVNVHLKNKDKRTALHEACRSESKDEDGLAEIARLLVECGCDMDHKSSDVGEADFTPLMFCAYHGHPKVAKILIDADCRINETGKNNWSALHWAADRGNIAVVEVLLHGGIDVFMKGMRDELAIDRATDNKIIEMISEAMELSDTEHKIAMETRGSLAKKLYVPRGGAKDNYENGLATSPRMENVNVATSHVFQSMQAQMVSLSDQVKSRKTRRVERRISQRIFEPPRPPAEEKDNVAPQLESPVSELIDGIDFMDDEDEEAGSNRNEEAGSNLNRDRSLNGISGSQSNGSIPSHQSNMSSLSTNSENVNGTILQNGIPENSRGDKSPSLKDISNVNGLCNSTQKVINNQQEVELFDENEIDGEGFADDMLH